MFSFYTIVFGVLAAIAALLLVKNGDWFGSSSGDVGTKEFKKLRNNYIVVYSLMMGAWLCMRSAIAMPFALPARCTLSSCLSNMAGASQS